MFQRKRSDDTPAEPTAAPPYMHPSDAAEDLEALMRHYTLQRGALVAQGLPAYSPHLLGVEAQLDACRRTLVAVRVASIAIDRSHSRGRLRG